MNFGEAIEQLKQGKMLCRTNWNGKELFVFQQIPAIINVEQIVPLMQSLPELVKKEFLNRLKLDKESSGGEAVLFYDIKYSNQLALVDPLNNITGWSPSTADALGEDWVVFE